MKKEISKTAILVFAALQFCSGVPEYPSYPPAHTVQTEDILFGNHISDPYRWLEDGHSPESQEWIKAENEYARGHLFQIPTRQKLLKRYRDLFYTPSFSVPQPAGKYLFYTRTFADKERPVLFWRLNGSAKETVLIDPNQSSWDKTLVLGEWMPSPNGEFVIYLVQANNADEATLHVMRVSTGQQSTTDTIEGAQFAEPAWSADSKGFYYMHLPTGMGTLNERVAQADIRYHRVGSDPSQDLPLYSNTGDGQLFLTPSTSSDGHWLFVAIDNGWTSRNLYVQDLRKKGNPFQPLFISNSAFASVQAWGDSFFLLTNKNASGYKVVRISAKQLSEKAWKTLVPERSGVVIQEMRVVGGYLILTTIEKASNHLEIRDLSGRLLQQVGFPGIGMVSDLQAQSTHKDAFVQFESFFMPPRIFKLKLPSGKMFPWVSRRDPVNPSPYHLEQLWYPSKDGTLISMFVITRKDRPQNRPIPFLMQGYGGFNTPMLPRFSAGIYPWLEAGGGFALPNLRGGSEYGEKWHRAGMLTKKQNTFDDFIAASEFLIKMKFTTADRLAIQGTSNGGLLIGAVVTQRPELFRVAICKNPLLDMIRFYMFGQGTSWIPEYGSPKEEDQFRALYAYSPYHHVIKGKAYPSLLFVSNENDDRVDPMHARKMAALMQATGSPNPIFLRTEANAGHAGSSSTTEDVEEWADRTAFLFDELGIH